MLPIASARHYKCSIVIPSCVFNENLDPINISSCPNNAQCQPNVHLLEQDDGCCCDSDNELDGRDLPYLNPQESENQEAIVLPTCIYENGLINGGFLNPCPESSECPQDTGLVLERFDNNIFKIGRCCCAPLKVIPQLKF